MIIETTFLILLFVLGYTWVGYPLLLTMAARGRRPKAEGLRVEGAEECSISSVAILLAAYNEEAVIERRLVNLVESKVAVHVGIDGCTDRTAAIAKKST